MVKLFDWMLTLQNDEILMQHNTSHVPNQAIPMNTFLQHPTQKNKVKDKEKRDLFTNIDPMPTLLATLKAISKRFF
jgi:hypothetical protein